MKFWSKPKTSVDINKSSDLLCSLCALFCWNKLRRIETCFNCHRGYRITRAKNELPASQRQGFGKELDDNSYRRLAPFSYEFRKTTLLVFLSLPAHAAVAPLFCTARKGGKSRPRGVPPLGYLPLGAVLHTQ